LPYPYRDSPRAADSSNALRERARRSAWVDLCSRTATYVC
jgi:hypothetical protein